LLRTRRDWAKSVRSLRETEPLQNVEMVARNIGSVHRIMRSSYLDLEPPSGIVVGTRANKKVIPAIDSIDTSLPRIEKNQRLSEARSNV
jgi:hypothetical protein